MASLPTRKLVGALWCWILSIKFKISLRKWDKCRGAARMGDLLPAYCFSWHLPCDFQVTCLPYCYFLSFQYLTLLSLLTSSCGRRACGSFPATNLLFHSVHWQSRAFSIWPLGPSHLIGAVTSIICLITLSPLFSLFLVKC